jgi:putative tricarboxylic transport membrane protein
MSVAALRSWVQPARLITLALFLVFLVVVAVGSTYAPEARLFPTMVGIAGMAMAIAVLAFESGAAPESVEDTSDDLSAASAVADHPPRGRVLLAVLAAPVYALLVWVLGFYIASLAALIVLPQCLDYRRIGLLTVIACVAVALIAVVFSWGMEMALPNGLVGDWVLRTFVYDR